MAISSMDKGEAVGSGVEMWATLRAQIGYAKISISYEVKQAMVYASIELKEVVQAKYRNLEAGESKYRRGFNHETG